MATPTAQNRSLTGFFLKGIREGTIQLPEFQRDFVWRDSDQKELFESIINLHPVGSILLLEIDQVNPQFAWTGFHGVTIPEEAVFGYNGDGKIIPDYLVLDGQQRLTSMAHMLIGNTNNTWFLMINNLYEDWINCDEPEGEDLEIWLSGLSLASDFVKKGAYSNNPGRLFLGPVMKMPLKYATSETLATGRIRELRISKEGAAADDRTRAVTQPLREEEFNQAAALKTKQAGFVDIVIRRLLRGIFESQLPSIEIPRGMDIDGICKVFTKINTTGVSLGAFDLCVAKLYPRNISLVSKFNVAIEGDAQTKAVDEKKKILLLASTAMHAGHNPKTATLPRIIDEEVFNEYWNEAVVNFGLACKFMTDELGVSLDAGDSKYLPYPTIIPPLSVLIGSSLKNETDVRVRQIVISKLRAWCASAPMGRRYSDGTDVKQVQDVQSIGRWLVSGSFSAGIPSWMESANPVIIKELLLSSSQGKAFISLLNNTRAQDWYSNEVVGRGAGRVSSDIHHIFPKAAMREKVRQSTGEGSDAVERMLKREYFIDNVSNLTWIAQSTNRDYIRDRLPSEYIAELITHHAAGQPNAEGRRILLAKLEQHAIDDSALTALEEDDYFEFIRIRSAILANKYMDAFSCRNISLESLDGEEE